MLPKPAGSDAEAAPDAASANQDPAQAQGSCFDPTAFRQAGPDALAALSEAAAARQQAGHPGHADAACTQHTGCQAAEAPHMPQQPAEAAVPRAEPHGTGQVDSKQQQASAAAAQQPQSHQKAQQQGGLHQERQQGQAHLHAETPAGAAADPSGSEQPTTAAPSEAEERSQPAGPAGPGSEAQAATTTAGYVSGAYTQREAFLQGLEAAGEMSFEYVRNNGQRHSSMW